MIVVVIKFTTPRMDVTPAKFREKIARSTDAPSLQISVVYFFTRHNNQFL
jgi:N-glycosylase/DNA lyase